MNLLRIVVGWTWQNYECWPLRCGVAKVSLETRLVQRLQGVCRGEPWLIGRVLERVLAVNLPLKLATQWRVAATDDFCYRGLMLSGCLW